MADFPRIELSKIGWDVNPAQDAITLDLSGAIRDRVNRIYRIITKAEDDKLKSLFEECFEASAEYMLDGGPDFEQWWQQLLTRLREELDEGHPCGDHPAPCNHDPAHER